MSASLRRAFSFFVEIEAYGAQHVRRLGELDVGVFNHFDPVAPAVEKIEERPRHELAAGLVDPGAHARAIIDGEPEMPPAVLVWRRRFHQVDELVAELDEGISRPFCALAEIKDLSIKFEGLRDVAHFEGDVVDADEPRLAPVNLADLGHGRPRCWCERCSLTI